jgi:dolichol-phosphate mannosyltransferase
MSSAETPLLTVILPVYNEVRTLERAVALVQAVPLSKELVVIDDASTDGTREIVERLEGPGVRIVLKQRNIGKGDSVRTGIGMARGQYAVVQDADLEYDPQDLVALVAAVQQPRVLVAFGSRQLWLRAQGRQLPSNVHNLGRKFLDLVYRLLYGGHVTDASTCYKVAPTAVLQRLDLRGDGFDLDFETLAKLTRCAASRGERIVERPVAYYPRSVTEGKKIRWWHGIEAVSTLVRYRFWRCPAPMASEPAQR